MRNRKAVRIVGFYTPSKPYGTSPKGVRGVEIVNDLDGQIGLIVCDLPFDTAVNRAMALDWTRDSFDRLISTQAMCRGIPLLSKDKTIRRRVKLATW